MIAYFTAILALVGISALVGLALNLQWGLCGMVNFGLAGFFALGAYGYALLALAGIPPILALAAAAVVAAIPSAALALFAVRLEEDYLAIVTVGFAAVVQLISLNEGWLTHGALGLPNIPQPLSSFVAPGNYPTLFLVIVLVLLGLVYLILEALTRSPFGRMVRAIRDDDVVASALGKRTVNVRVKVFALGGAIVGVAGALHASYLTYIDPSQFTLAITGYAFIAVVAGGRGSNGGLLLGTGTIMLFLEGTRFLEDFIPQLGGAQLAALRLGAIGVGLLLLLIYRPQGFFAESHLNSQSLLSQRNEGKKS